MRVSTTMTLPPRWKLAIAVWCVGELAAFSIVGHYIGLAGAILIGVATSLLGSSILRRAGSSALAKLRSRVETRQPAPGPDFLDETLATTGAVALLLPGFLSDVVGLALAIPNVRDAVVARLGRGGLGEPRTGRRAHHGPTTIDLAPEEWHKTGPARGPVSDS